MSPKNHVSSSWLRLVIMVSMVLWTKAGGSTVSSTTSSLSPSTYQCGNPQQATEIATTTTTTTTTGSTSSASDIQSIRFDTIETNLLGLGDGWKRRKSEQPLIPQTIHWHIYAIDNGETPKYSCYPEGLVKPQISGSTLQLALTKKDGLKELGYHRGDAIQSSINLYIPVENLRNIQMSGVNEVLEVIVNETLLTNISTTSSSTLLPSIRIGVSGVDSTLFVNAPYSPIYLSASGVDSEATIHGGRNSTVDLSGVDQRVRIKSDYLSGNVGLSGISTRLMVDGDYNQISMSGIDCQVQVVNSPSGCNSVHNSGINNNCGVAQNSNVTVPELDCLSTTTVVEACSFSIGAVVGVSIASLLVIGFCVLGCIFTCRRSSRRRRQQQQLEEQERQKQFSMVAPQVVQQETAPGSSMPPAGVLQPVSLYDHREGGNVVEAEVIGIEPSHHATTDPAELAKGNDEKV